MTTAASAVKALTCPSCCGGIEMRAAGQTISPVCGHCGTMLDATTPELRVLAAANQAMHRPAIALGTRGVVRGVDWEAIGYVERSGGGGDWFEYLMFNLSRAIASSSTAARASALAASSTASPASRTSC